MTRTVHDQGASLTAANSMPTHRDAGGPPRRKAKLGQSMGDVIAPWAHLSV